MLVAMRPRPTSRSKQRYDAGCKPGQRMLWVMEDGRRETRQSQGREGESGEAGWEGFSVLGTQGNDPGMGETSAQDEDDCWHKVPQVEGRAGERRHEPAVLARGALLPVGRGAYMKVGRSVAQCRGLSSA